MRYGGLSGVLAGVHASGRCLVNTTLAQRLRLVRGKTPQAGFAGKVGIHKSSWGRYERGEGEPVGSDLIKICSVCDINPQWLLLGQGLMRPGAPDGVSASPPEGAAARPVAPAAVCVRCVRLEEKLDALDRERRELSLENRQLWKENGLLRERLARCENPVVAADAADLAGPDTSAA